MCTPVLAAIGVPLYILAKTFQTGERERLALTNKVKEKQQFFSTLAATHY